jgi:16S rRNA (guanine527-N7)-methyltransferase
MFHVEHLARQVREHAALLGIPLDKKASEALIAHLVLLAEWNDRLNLVGPGTPETWVGRHTLDSLIPARMIATGMEVLDVGSGAGFPGIPLAIAHPGASLSLAERRAKRRAFLQNVLATASIANASVIEAPEATKQYDLVLGRAVQPAREWLIYAAPFVRPGGWVGVFSRSDAPEPAVPQGLRFSGAKDYTLPGDDVARRFSWFERFQENKTQ